MKITKYKKKDNKTYYKFTISLKQADGTRVVTSRRGFSTKTDAEVEYVKLKNKETDMITANFKFKEVYSMWLNNYKLTVRESTLSKTMGLFDNHILPSLGDKYIKKISLNTLQDCVNQWYTSTKNYKKLKCYTSKVFDYALKHGYIAKNNVKLVTLPKPKVEKKKLNYLNKEELNIFLKTAKEVLDLEWYAFMRLLAFSGIRRGEALALTWNDINFKTSTLTINKTLSNGLNGGIMINPTKTIKGNRNIVLDRITLDILKDWRKEQSKNNFNPIIFTNTKNTYTCFSKPNKKVKLVCKKARIKRITTHGLRHTHCSILFEAGANIGEVQKRLGHNDVHTTMNIYNHVSEQRDKEVLDKLTEYIAF